MKNAPNRKSPKGPIISIIGLFPGGRAAGRDEEGDCSCQARSHAETRPAAHCSVRPRVIRRYRCQRAESRRQTHHADTARTTATARTRTGQSLISDGCASAPPCPAPARGAATPSSVARASPPLRRVLRRARNLWRGVAGHPPRRSGDPPVEDGSAEERLARGRRRHRARVVGFPRLVRVVRRQVQKKRPRPETRGPGAGRLRRRDDIRRSREVRLPAQWASGSAGRHSGTTSVPSPPTLCDRPAHRKTRFFGSSFSRLGSQAFMSRGGG